MSLVSCSQAPQDHRSIIEPHETALFVVSGYIDSYQEKPANSEYDAVGKASAMVAL